MNIAKKLVLQFLSIRCYGNSTKSVFFPLPAVKQTCLSGLGTAFLSDLKNAGLYLMIDSKASLSQSIWVCFTWNSSLLYTSEMSGITSSYSKW